MLSFVVRSWAAWAPGLVDADAWARWCREPAPLAGAGSPRLDFLPALFRRRCSPLSRLMLHVAYAACGPEEVATLPVVFASRYGELALTLSLLESIARAEPLTAAGFTHSVHNAPLGLFSIAARNRGMATALSAGLDTFGCSMLEALALLERAGGGAALLVIADEPMPPLFAPFDEAPSGSYALALRVARPGDGPAVTLGPANDTDGPRPPWPHALEFLRWMLSTEPALTLRGRRAWRWTRG